MRGTGSWPLSASSVNAVDRTWLRGDGEVCLGSMDGPQHRSPAHVENRSVPADGELRKHHAAHARAREAHSTPVEQRLAMGLEAGLTVERARHKAQAGIHPAVTS
jgi:hypothetical protein